MLFFLFFVISPLIQKLTHKPGPLPPSSLSLQVAAATQQHGNSGNKDDTATSVTARRRQRDSREVAEGIAWRQQWREYCGGGGGAAAALAWRHWVARLWQRLRHQRSGNGSRSAEVAASLAVQQWRRRRGNRGGSAAGGGGDSAVAAIARRRWWSG